MASNFSNPDYLRKEQYRTDGNLNARIALHERFSINKGSWTGWVLEQIRPQAGQRVLDAGCGPGNLWAENREQLPAGLRVVLADLSPGMVGTARTQLRGEQAFQFVCCDVQQPSLAANTFDIIIANHMLYHVPDIGAALGALRRVLKPGGVFCATTNGAGHLGEIWDWVLEALPERMDARRGWEDMGRFSLENGEEWLAPHFGRVERRLREDGLEITKVQPLLDFVVSSSVLQGFSSEELAILGEHLEGKLREKGVLQVTKNTGIFVAREPRPAFSLS